MFRQDSHRRRMGGGFAAFLALLLVLQTAIASFAMSPVTNGDGVQIVICGAGGLRTITLDSEGNPTENPAGGAMQGDCPFCVIGYALADVAPVTVETGLSFRTEAFAPPIPVFAIGPPTGRAHAIRAPPKTIVLA